MLGMAVCSTSSSSRGKAPPVEEGLEEEEEEVVDEEQHLHHLYAPLLQEAVLGDGDGGGEVQALHLLPLPAPPAGVFLPHLPCGLVLQHCPHVPPIVGVELEVSTELHGHGAHPLLLRHLPPHPLQLLQA